MYTEGYPDTRCLSSVCAEINDIKLVKRRRINDEGEAAVVVMVQADDDGDSELRSELRRAYADFMSKQLADMCPANMTEFEEWWQACLTIAEMKSGKADVATVCSITDKHFERVSATARRCRIVA